SRRRHTRFSRDWSSDVCSSDLKLRLLNGAHSYLAYAGSLAGHATIAEAVADPALAVGVRALQAEAVTTLDAPDGVDLAAYARTQIGRAACREGGRRPAAGGASG